MIEKNLYVYVRNGGKSRIFFFCYKVNQKRKEMSLGNALAKPIRVAKAEAATLRADIASGKDPIEERRKRAAELAEKQNAETFAEFFDHALPKILHIRSFRRAEEETSFRNKVTTYAMPIIGKRLMSEITKEDIIEVLKPIWMIKPVLVKRLREYLELVFNLAMAENIRVVRKMAISWTRSKSFSSFSEFRRSRSLISNFSASAATGSSRIFKSSGATFPDARAILFSALLHVASLEKVPAPDGEMRCVVQNNRREHDRSPQQ